MSKSAIEHLDVDAPVRKRAQWEAFEFTLLGDGRIEVANQSYSDAEEGDHTYTVEIEDGEPVTCDCQYSEYHDGDCKHMAAVAIRGPVLDSATASEHTPLIFDGGITQEGETCPNGDDQCGGPQGKELPCFPCYLDSEGL